MATLFLWAYLSALYPFIFFISASVLSEKRLTPTVWVCGTDSNSAIFSRFFLKMADLNSNSALVPYLFPKVETKFMNL